MRIGDEVYWRDEFGVNCGKVLAVDYDCVAVWADDDGAAFIERGSLHKSYDEAKKGEEAKYV